MDGLGHQFLAGAVLAKNKYRGVSGRNPVDLLAQVGNAGAFAGDAVDALALFPENPVFPGEAVKLEALVDGMDDLVVGERFFDEVIGSVAGGRKS